MTDQSDLAALAAYHDTASDATTHRPALVGCSCSAAGGGWIPAEEQLPELRSDDMPYSVGVLIVRKHHHGNWRSLGRYVSESSSVSAHWKDLLEHVDVRDVTHWQPLPPLPGDAPSGDDMAEPLTMETCRAMLRYWQARLEAAIDAAVEDEGDDGMEAWEIV